LVTKIGVGVTRPTSASAGTSQVNSIRFAGSRDSANNIQTLVKINPTPVTDKRKLSFDIAIPSPQSIAARHDPATVSVATMGNVAATMLRT